MKLVSGPCKMLESFPIISDSAYPHNPLQALLHPITRKIDRHIIDGKIYWRIRKMQNAHMNEHYYLLLNDPVHSVTTNARVSFALSSRSSGSASLNVLGNVAMVISSLFFRIFRSFLWIRLRRTHCLKRRMIFQRAISFSCLVVILPRRQQL